MVVLVVALVLDAGLTAPFAATLVATLTAGFADAFGVGFGVGFAVAVAVGFTATLFPLTTPLAAVAGFDVFATTGATLDLVDDTLDGLGFAAFGGDFLEDAALAEVETDALPIGFLDLDVDINPQRR